VNFFGHAVVACWFDPSPEFVLGAMLPDLTAMLRLRLPSVMDSRQTAGILLHHRTDAVFHEAQSFVELSRHARVSLAARGIGRGPSRALAHVGIEILLDELLGQDRVTENAYLAALAAANAFEAATAVDTRRLRELTQRLAERGIARSLSPELVARRLRYALEPHPKLSFSPAEEPTVAAWVSDSRPLVAARADELVAELRGRLEAPPLGA
jgi:hypothetical protein